MSRAVDDSGDADSEGVFEYDWQFSYEGFADHYDLHAAFLPYEGRPRKHFEDLDEITAFLTSRPPWNKGTSMRYITHERLDTGPNEWNCQAGDNIELLAVFHGWWKTGRTKASSRRFGNPDYVHRDSQTYITDTDDREEYARTAASLGYVSPAQVGLAFGLYPDDYEELADEDDEAYRREAFLEVADEMGLDWTALREAGRLKMARTWKTIVHWGFSLQAVATVFDLDADTVEQAIQRVDGFAPPDDPTAEESCNEVVR